MKAPALSSFSLISVNRIRSSRRTYTLLVAALAVFALLLGQSARGAVKVLSNAPGALVVTITPASTPTAADNDYTRINNAIQSSSAGETLILDGSFDWTEANAAASWALGSNGIAGDVDDYSILVPANLNNVTLTANNFGDATIQGPGDLAAVDLEGVLFFDGGDNQNWTISNIRFLDFDLSIGMFNGAGGSDAYNNTHISNNYIRIARDLNATVAPGDSFQNIGIHFSFGTNQVISGNTIEIQGDGVSDGSNFATDVAMQSNTSGGAVYDGLQITNNTVRVLHAQSGNPEVILGIWENAHGHSSNITVSGNTFENQDAVNDPAVNLQRAFRVTSHSSATTTVTYSNNTITGANIGFQWIVGSDFSGNQPVILTSNTITGNAIGVLVQSLGEANLSFNRIVGNSVAGVNNATAGTVTAENNWWGCNAGPGNTGCDGVLGTVDFDPWIVLQGSATPNSIAPGGTSTVAADMTHNSDGAVPSGTLPDIPVAYSATHGTMNPTTSNVVAGASTSTFTSTDTSSAVATITVDSQTVNVPITVTAPPPLIVTITPAGAPTASDNDYTRINNAIQSSFAGQTIILNGTFNWTEANAAASWALGSNGVSGDGDDYSIVPPAGLNNVTLTANSFGDATIQGPGDLPGVNLEGVLSFNGGDNQTWTISNIRFLDFDLSIGMFNGAGGSDAYDGTHISNNYIRIARDLNATVAPADVNQNIGIHFSFGTNQVISGNTIEIQGDGVSDGSNFATDVAMQSNTSGGAVYDGLQITNNIIRVLHAQSGNPQVVLGIWENAHGHTSNITISGNTFENPDAGNNSTVNLQRAFRVTSHSSATTTVTYSNNTITGANIGFQWLAGSNFSGNQPVILTSNTITGNATGVLVQSQGSANLSFNRIVGNSVAGVNNSTAGTVTAENNWWGCNAGPGNTGCDGVLGTVDFDPWIVLQGSATPNSIAPGGTSTVAADMTHNSDGTVPSGTLPDIPVAYSATNGTMNPTNDTIIAGTDSSQFTSTNGSSAVATITVDSQPVNVPITVTAPTISIDDVIVSEPTAGTSTATFTVSLSGTQSSPVTVDYATADGSAVAPGDYTAIPTTQLMFATGQTTQTVSVTINSDGLPEGNENFFVNLSNPSVNATILDGQGEGTITDPAIAGNLLISEFRFHGAAGPLDEFVELYNNTNSPITIATSDGSNGWTLTALNAAGTAPTELVIIPNGTVIPARGHLLAVNNTKTGGYSLTGYAAADASYLFDIADDGGVAVFRTNDPVNFTGAYRLDAAGFAGPTGAAADLHREGAGLTSPGAINGDYTFARKLITGLPQDTDDNAADFDFIAPDAGIYGALTAILGAPGPEDCGCYPPNLFANGSPVQHNADIKASLIEPAASSTVPPNRVRDSTPGVCGGPNCTQGTLELRRRFKNNTGASVTRLRFRIVDVTTLNTPNPGGAQADIRWLTSGDLPITTSLGNLTLRGTVIEVPPTQALGGGLNSSGVVTIPGGVLAPGATIDVRFLLGVEAGGRFRFLVNVEALP